MKTYDVSLMHGTVNEALHITKLEVYTLIYCTIEDELRYETYVKVYHDGQSTESYVYDHKLLDFVTEFLMKEDPRVYSKLPALNWCESGMSTDEYYSLIFGVW